MFTLSPRFLLSPRFFAMPLIALAIIIGLAHASNTSHNSGAQVAAPKVRATACQVAPGRAADPSCAIVRDETRVVR
jgi:hypothetical protein